MKLDFFDRLKNAPLRRCVFVSPGAANIYILFTDLPEKHGIIGLSEKRSDATMNHILIVEDDSEIRQLYSRVLTRNGYRVTGAANGQEALDAMEHAYFDLIICDIMMPVMNGYELVRALRGSGDTTPVMMITAKDAFDDKRQGFLLGTDDYMVKPIDVDEMVLRVGALLRRSQIRSDRSLTLGGTRMDMDAFSVTVGTEVRTLPQKEFLLLYKLASYPGKIFTRIQLMDEIWGADSETGWETVTVHIGRLRKRFEHWDEFDIVSVRGLGYKAVKHR
jgi:DNA-binding response OmpR family regulator